MTRRLYNLGIPDSAQTLSRNQLQRRTARLGDISEEPAITESVTLEPGEILLQGSFRGTYAQQMAAEVEELFDAPSIGVVPVFGTNGGFPEDGYYTLSDATVERADPRETRLQQFDGTLTRQGTKRTHWRAQTSGPNNKENDFGSDTTGYVGVDVSATKIRWLNPVDGSTEDPSLVATRNGEHTDIEIYDTQVSNFSKPTLIYELEYVEEGKADVTIWDTKGNSDKTDSNSVLQWQRVFHPQHDLDDSVVFDNSLVRITIDESSNSISAEDWNDGTSSWDSVSLGTSDWQPYDIDITTIDTCRIVAQIEFENTSNNNRYSLDMILPRGFESPQWVRPINESDPTPTGLQTLLNPIASDQVVNVAGSSAVIKRKETRL